MPLGTERRCTRCGSSLDMLISEQLRSISCAKRKTRKWRRGGSRSASRDARSSETGGGLPQYIAVDTNWMSMERMDTIRCVRTPCRNRRQASVHFPRGASMTNGELRIIEFLMTSDATRPADLPDWLLALLEGDRPEELSAAVITTGPLQELRRF